MTSSQSQPQALKRHHSPELLARLKVVPFPSVASFLYQTSYHRLFSQILGADSNQLAIFQPENIAAPDYFVSEQTGEPYQQSCKIPQR